MTSKAFLLIALVATSAAFAITPGSSAAITLALTVTIESPGIKLTDPYTKEVTYVGQNTTRKTNANGDILSEVTEFKTVVNVLRYGNAQVIREMNDQGLLDGTVSGWSIISVDLANNFVTENYTGPSSYVVKKGRPPIPLQFTSSQTAWAEAVTGKLTVDNVRQSVNVSVSNNYKTTVTLSLADFNIQGTRISTSKVVTGKLGKGTAAVDYTFPISGGTKIAAFSGTYSERDVAEGSLVITAGKVVDIETLGFAPSVSFGGGNTFIITPVDTTQVGVNPN